MLPRLWATRKIGYLLNRIRLDGADKETIQQIVQLSVRYGIVTAVYLLPGHRTDAPGFRGAGTHGR